MPYYRKNLFVLWLTTFLAAASWTQVVPFLPLYLEELGVTENLPQWSGMVFSLQFAAGILMAPFWGRMADRHGRKLMAVRAGFSLAAIYYMTGLATQAWHVAVLRFLNGALTGFIPSSITLVATNTPRRLAASYVASLQTASAAGAIVGPVIGGVLAGGFGYRGALYASGTAVLLSTLLVLVVVEERLRAASAKRTTLIEDFRTAFHSPALLTVMWTTLLAMIASISVQPILTIYVEELLGARSESISGVIFALPGIAVVLSARRWVKVGKKIGYRAIIRRVLGATGITGLLLPVVPSIYWFGLLFFIQALFAAALRPVASAIISEEVDESFGGRAFGMQQSAVTLGGMLGPLLAGFISGSLGNRYVFAAIGLILIAGALGVREQEAQTAETKRAPAAPSLTPRSPRG